ncbi:Rne/Rng family ribonuclease [Nocardioides sp. CN2-186]|uniref:Rne/Rng family ribonuclease n=1 Tax=Nocardioides tweenelious TaxID=3156607 RepID=UPI0032B3C538
MPDENQVGSDIAAESASTEAASAAPVAKKTTTRKTAAKKAPAKKTAKKAAEKAAEQAADPAPDQPLEGTDVVPAKKTATKKAAAKKAPAKKAAKKVAAAPDEAPAAAEQPVETAASGTVPLFQAPEVTKKAPARRTRKTTPSAEAAEPSEPSEAPAGDASEDQAAADDAKPVKKAAAKKSAAKKTAAKKGASKAPAADDAAQDAPADPQSEDQSDDQSDGESEGGEGGARRRRRRGGRRRRKPGEGNQQDGNQGGNQQSDDDESSDGEDKGDDAGSDDHGGESGSEGTSRRRRRRRRSGEDGDGGTDDPENTVTRVRRQRTAEDEITSIQGSTRLEAKKQRRRDGREAGRRRAPIVSEAEFLARRESVDRVMVVRQRDDLTQIGVLEDRVLVEHYVARESQTSLIGNVYLGRVQNVLPSMEAAFIDIGKGRNAVLYAGEVNWSALGHKDGQPRKIESVLSSGQSILVQVSKDPIGHKGARLTSQISLAGRFLVYVPDGTTSGISRKLPDTERNRLKTLLKELVPDTAGVIVRTAAEGASEDELTRDVERLKARWEDIESKAKGSAPQLLYGEPDLTLKVVRDLFTEDFAKLVIQGDDAWDTVQSYVQHVAPDLEERLERYDPGADGRNGKADVFAEYRIEEQIAKGLDRKVWLPSGGSLIIDRTEAMTVIDVNTGKFTGSGGNLEETVTKNNLEAVEEVVRQLRLRDIGGIIVVDFIDMVLESNRDLVLRRLVECLGRDRTRHQVAEVTSLGLVQMTRKRIGTGLVEAFSENCTACQGRGVVIHDHPVEPKGGEDESRRRGGGGGGGNGGGAEGGGGRRGRGGRGRGQDQDAGNGGNGGNGGNNNGPKSAPSPKDIAAMAREHEEETAEQAAEPVVEPVVEPPVIAEAPETAPEPPKVVTRTRRRSSSRPAGQPAPVEVAAEPVADTAPEPSPEPTPEPVVEPVVEAPSAPEPPKVVTRTRGRSASRPAGPPAEVPAPVGSVGSVGTPPESGLVEPGTTTDVEPGADDAHPVEHVPIKKKGSRKR